MPESSRGPVFDGRLRPSITAQGRAVVSAASDANLLSGNCTSCSLEGTSMSTPTTAGLAALVRNELRRDPFTGTVFVFRSKRADRAKILFWDGSGLVMVYKRLEDHKFAWPPIRDGMMKLNHAQFEALFDGLDWRRVYVPNTRPPMATE